MKLQEFLDCEHDIDMNSSMTRLYCVKCLQDANVIEYVKKLEEKINVYDSDLYDLETININLKDKLNSITEIIERKIKTEL